MAEAPPRLRAQQYALTRHLRDPDGASPPPGIEERRLAVYRELLFNNLRGLLASNFPVIARTLGGERWIALVRAFLRDHRCRTPLFPELGREFLRYLEGADGLPAFLPELAHYEWAELALQISEASLADAGAEPLDRADPRPALLDRAPVLSPLAWPLAYRWPVHTIGPEYQPHAPPEAPTLLMLRREADGRVRFSRLSPLAWRLVERLRRCPGASGRAQLLALAAEAGASDPGPFLDGGGALLAQMAATGVIAGTRAPQPAA
ncbi:putative DNA-binding domain-containing protein [Luteimonas sp. RD2P54]|uniref:DNA-binding domain-containing protein n=1 Tax=Luteimonas endophytica TaxID=3042023 RepID=A0ABT6J3X2_9GAMM|nr:putative DNA-binding domain-containing protein [Luteimonas endophytica]MDH5821523.1 putative DNA-binding domain-containing protein [Luteimonas endophytica]